MSAWSRAERMAFLHADFDSDIEQDSVYAETLAAEYPTDAEREIAEQETDWNATHSPFRERVILSCDHFAYADEVVFDEAQCVVCMVERSVIKP